LDFLMNKRFCFMAFSVLMLAASEQTVAQDRSSDKLTATRLHRVVANSPAELRELFHYNGTPLPLLSAHRGGAGPGYPENCIETFEHTLHQTFSMLEIDPRVTKDGQFVVHHDATLDRTTTGTGKVADKTLQELKQLRLKDSEGNVTDFRIPTLDEVFVWAKEKTILVLDQKDVPLETRIAKIEEHNAESYAMLIVGNLKDAQTVYATNKKIMMEAMLGDFKKIAAFDSSQVPWENVIVFLGHDAPKDVAIYAAIHDKGARTMIGTSRNLDRDFASRASIDLASLREDYKAILHRGADVIETDIPRELGRLLADGKQTDGPPATFFSVR